MTHIVGLWLLSNAPHRREAGHFVEACRPPAPILAMTKALTPLYRESNSAHIPCPCGANVNAVANCRREADVERIIKVRDWLTRDPEAKFRMNSEEN
jgi:hypothetical protein